MSLLSGLNFNKIFSGNAGASELAIVEQILSPVIGNTLQALLTGQNAGDAFFGALGAVAQSAGSGIFAQAVNAVGSEKSGTVMTFCLQTGDHGVIDDLRTHYAHVVVIGNFGDLHSVCSLFTRKKAH